MHYEDEDLPLLAAEIAKLPNMLERPVESGAAREGTTAETKPDTAETKPDKPAPTAPNPRLWSRAACTGRALRPLL